METILQHAVGNLQLQTYTVEHLDNDLCNINGNDHNFISIFYFIIKHEFISVSDT